VGRSLAVDGFFFEQLGKNDPSNTVLKLYWLPILKATIEPNIGNSPASPQPEHGSALLFDLFESAISRSFFRAPT
jgi:hypothetical protein